MCGNIDIVQAYIMKLPFKDKTFDVIFSIGVLHHTPDTKRAFQCLPKLLRDSGEIAIWVYSNEGIRMRAYNAVAAVYRFFTTKLPKDRLYTSCAVLPCPCIIRTGFRCRALSPEPLCQHHAILCLSGGFSILLIGCHANINGNTPIKMS